jgi:hypothetical protein
MTSADESTTPDPGFPLIEVRGSAFEMGYQHGHLAAEMVEKYLVWIEKLTGRPRDVLCRAAVRFLPAMERLSAAYVEEVRGLSEGAGISFEEALLCQARAEAAQAHGQQAAKAGCTAFAVRGRATRGGATLAGQNQDLAPEYADVALLVRVVPNDGRPRALMFTFAGQLGYAGMNEHGLAHFANALYDCPWRLGVPHYPLKRVLLEQRTIGDCVSLLRKHPACSAANVVLCSGDGEIADCEVRPEGVEVYDSGDPDCIVHANHYLCEAYTRYETNTLPDSCPRLERMRDLIRGSYGDLTVERMKEILSDHDGDPAAICRHGAERMHSISGYIAEPGAGTLHVRRGHGCTGTWRAYPV